VGKLYQQHQQPHQQNYFEILCFPFYVSSNTTTTTATYPINQQPKVEIRLSETKTTDGQLGYKSTVVIFWSLFKLVCILLRKPRSCQVGNIVLGNVRTRKVMCSSFLVLLGEDKNSVVVAAGGGGIRYG
jgi:hypothetical protein